METFCNTWIVSSILVSEMRWFGVDLVDQNRSYHIRVDISIHLTSKFNLDVKTGSLVGYVFRIDDAQADYADFPITNIRVDKPMEFVPWDTEKNKKTPLWTGDWDHPLGPLGTLVSKVDLQAGFP